jgi:hypothetical protein
MLSQLFAECWKDDALKARFLKDPKSVLAECGFVVPDGIDVQVVENSATTVHITMPMFPQDEGSLSDEDLANVAGGVNTPDWDASKHYCTSWQCPK